MKKELGCFVLGDSSKCTGCKACELACLPFMEKEQSFPENRGNGDGSCNTKTVSHKI